MTATLAAILLLTAQSWSPHPVLAEVRVGAPAVGAPVKRAVVPGVVEELGPEVSADAAVVVDAASGAVLYGKRPQRVRALASITKLLTAIVVADATAWDHIVAIERADLPPEGHTVLAWGDRVTVRDLFAALLVGSDNGAANALARGIGGSPEAFVSRMRAAVTRIGPTFRVADPAGLRPENAASAVEVARLARAAFARAEIRDLAALPAVTINAHRPGRERLRVRATNLLARDGIQTPFRIIGAKTGYLDESGFNFALEAEHDGRAVMIVTLGSATNDDRFRDARILAAWVFERFRWE